MFMYAYEFDIINGCTLYSAMNYPIDSMEIKFKMYKYDSSWIT